MLKITAGKRRASECGRGFMGVISRGNVGVIICILPCMTHLYVTRAIPRRVMGTCVVEGAGRRASRRNNTARAPRTGKRIRPNVRQAAPSEYVINYTCSARPTKSCKFGNGTK